ncbi:MAG: hypothetical protein IPN32_20040 [Deltaproteobacteria bacterium]|nr:hypothetical protein [Deltaproteobacteria bacterium]
MLAADVELAVASVLVPSADAEPVPSPLTGPQASSPSVNVAVTFEPHR